MVYTCEMATQKYHAMIISVGVAFVAVKAILTTLHSELHYNTVSHLWINLIVNILTLPIHAWLVPESLSFLLARGTRREFYTAMMKLHFWNHTCSRIDDKIDF